MTDQNQGSRRLDISITGEEWVAAASLLPFMRSDERDVLGMLLLTCDGDGRRWWATDSRRLATDEGGADDRRYELLVSPRLVHFAATQSRDDADTVVSMSATFDTHGACTSVEVSGPAGSLNVSGDNRPFPDVRTISTIDHVEPPARITVDGLAVGSLMRQAATRALPVDDDESEPRMWVTVAESHLEVSIDWPNLGTTVFRLTGERVGDPSVGWVISVPPVQLADALQGWPGPVTVTLPALVGVPLEVAGGGRRVLIMPNETPAQVTRRLVEEVLGEVFGPDVLHRDADGDYLLSSHGGTPVYARLREDRPMTLQLFARVLDKVQATPELLAELNDLNTNVTFARTFVVDGQVLAESDLVADTIDPEELLTSFDRVRRLTDEIAPMLAVVHGGEPTTAHPDNRWHHYGTTVVAVEDGNGGWTPLNGDQAIADWPFTGTVHVLTAAEPFGRQRPPEVDTIDNANLAHRLWLDGHLVRRATGADPTGAHIEPGILVAGLGRTEALALGRQLDQEAIFEINSQELLVLACFDDRIDVHPRQAESNP